MKLIKAIVRFVLIVLALVFSVPFVALYVLGALFALGLMWTEE